MEPKLPKVRQVREDGFYKFIEELACEGAVMLAPLDKFRHCIIGVTSQGLILYSREKIVEVFMDDGMTLEEADEYCSYNTERAIEYVEEEKRPIIVAFEIP